MLSAPQRSKTPPRKRQKIEPPSLLPLSSRRCGAFPDEEVDKERLTREDETSRRGAPRTPWRESNVGGDAFPRQRLGLAAPIAALDHFVAGPRGGGWRDRRRAEQSASTRVI